MNILLTRRCWHLVGRSGRRTLQKSLFHTSPIWNKKVLQKFKLADIGEGITECEVIRWTVQPHAQIAAFDPLCEVQSDKASVEITSPFDGIVKEILVKEGDIAKVGEGLCLIEVESDGEAVEEEAHTTTPTDADKASETTARSAPSSEDLAPPRPRAAERQPEPQRRHPLDPKYTPLPSSASSSSPSTSSVDILAPPSVRHFARVNGVDLALLAPGSGRGGRIEKADVQAYLDGGSANSTSTSTTPQLSQTPSREEGVVELGRTRYGMWKAMEKSLEIPHFGYSALLDLTKLHQMLPTLNANIPPQFLPASSPALEAYKKRYSLVHPHSVYAKSSARPTELNVPETYQYTRITMLPILLKTLSKAMSEWPLFRSTITPSSSSSRQAAKPTLTIRPHADISLALSTPSGLYAPTLPAVDLSSIYTLASRITHLSTLARTTGLGPNELPKRGGAISVSNVGAVGRGVFASPVLVPGSGGVAIVALGRARWEWDVDSEGTWEDGDVFGFGFGAAGEVSGRGRGRGGGKRGERRLKMGVSWSADHRVVEGAEMAAFVECWRSYVEQPERLIAEGV